MRQREAGQMPDPHLLQLTWTLELFRNQLCPRLPLPPHVYSCAYWRLLGRDAHERVISLQWPKQVSHTAEDGRWDVPGVLEGLCFQPWADPWPPLKVAKRLPMPSMSTYTESRLHWSLTRCHYSQAKVIFHLWHIWWGSRGNGVGGCGEYGPNAAESAATALCWPCVPVTLCL